MKQFIIYSVCFIVLLVAMPNRSVAQFASSSVHIEDGKLMVKIKQKNDDYEHLMQYFGLDEDSLFKYHNLGHLANEGWKIKKINKRKAIIYKRLNEDKIDAQWGIAPLLFNLNNGNNDTPGYPGPVSYGINSFKGAQSVYESDDDVTIFELNNYTDAQHVFISGNFNDWSTGGIAMEKTNTGWVAKIKLKPGKYFYKFIVDGKWIFDPNNNIKESDGYNSFNSTYFHYNYTFKLDGFTDKKQVIIAGSFNDWNEQELKMNKTTTGWELGLYLKEGMHTYKFIVDKEWMLDPANSNVEDDGSGNINSVMSLGDPTLFELQGFPYAKTVVLSGSFNNWNPSAITMTKTATGWAIPYVLPQGNYEYKFIVDGDWITDPANNNTIINGTIINSVKVISANKTFELSNYPNANDVYVTGSFINWAVPGFKMIKVEGTWIFPCFLPAGKYTYKFVVDGNWILDPNNNNVEQNEYGTGNSVLWVAPESEFLDR